MNRRSFMSTILALGASPLPAQPRASGVVLKQVSSAVTWERFQLPPFPRSIMGPSPYGGTKHSRWARRSVDNCWYVLGGDYSHWGLPPNNGIPVSGSGSNILWKVTPGKPFVFAQLNGYVPTAGQKIPNRVDEAPWMYDSKRDRFLLYPYPRWTETVSPACITGHLMLYYPATNRWEDKGAGVYTGGTNYDKNNNPQFDVNGRQYPIGDAKWGVYDDVTDKYYIPEGTSRLLVLNAETLAMEWPIEVLGGTSPYTFYNQSFYTACLCLDKKRRRLVTIKSANNGDYSRDPNAYKLIAVDLDTRALSVIPSSGYPFDPVNPLYIDFEALVHDEATDLYLLYGGCYRIGNSESNLQATNDLRALPAQGGDWMKFLPTGIEPPPRYGQTMHWEPSLKQFFVLGGINDTSPQAPEMLFLTLHKEVRSAPPPSGGSVQLVGNLLSTLDPCPARTCPYSLVMGQAGVMAYSGMAFCPDYGTKGALVIAGGGHGDYAGNEVYRFDLATLQWARISEPSTALNGTQGDVDPTFDKVHGEYADGSPGSSHTYDHLRCIPGKNELIRIGAAAVYSGSICAGWAHAWDLTTGKARRASSNSYDMANSQGCTVYDSKRNKVWVTRAGASTVFASYDPTTETFTPVANFRANFGFDPVAFHYPAGDLMVIQSFGGSTYTVPNDFMLSAVDLANPGAGAKPITLTGDLPPAMQPFINTGWGVDWSDDHGAAFCCPGDPDRSSIYKLTPTANKYAWTVAKIALPTPLPLGIRSGVYGRWKYCPTIKKFAYASKTTNQLALWTPPRAT